jgi:hypothetical protein
MLNSVLDTLHYDILKFDGQDFREKIQLRFLQIVFLLILHKRIGHLKENSPSPHNQIFIWFHASDHLAWYITELAAM